MTVREVLNTEKDATISLLAQNNVRLSNFVVVILAPDQMQPWNNYPFSTCFLHVYRVGKNVAASINLKVAVSFIRGNPPICEKVLSTSKVYTTHPSLIPLIAKCRGTG